MLFFTDGFAVSDVDWESKVACETVVRSDRRAQACAAFFLNLAPHAVHAFRFRSLGLRVSFVLEDLSKGRPKAHGDKLNDSSTIATPVLFSRQGFIRPPF